MIGNSMGGIVATKVAIDEPHRVSKLVTIGGMGKNTFSPGPGEGIKLLMEFTDNPTREALVRWLHSMVFDRAVRHRAAHRRALGPWPTEPTTLEIARRMYSSKAMARHGRGCRCVDRRAVLGAAEQDQGAKRC